MTTNEIFFISHSVPKPADYDSFDNKKASTTEYAKAEKLCEELNSCLANCDDSEQIKHSKKTLKTLLFNSLSDEEIIQYGLHVCGIQSTAIVLNGFPYNVIEKGEISTQ